MSKLHLVKHLSLNTDLGISKHNRKQTYQCLNFYGAGCSPKEQHQP